MCTPKSFATSKRSSGVPEILSTSSKFPMEYTYAICEEEISIALVFKSWGPGSSHSTSR